MIFKQYVSEVVKVKGGRVIDNDTASRCVECNDYVSFAEVVNGYVHCKYCRAKLGITERPVKKIDEQVKKAFGLYLIDQITKLCDKELRINPLIAEPDLSEKVILNLISSHPEHEVLIRYHTEKLISGFYEERKRMVSGN